MYRHPVVAKWRRFAAYAVPVVVLLLIGLLLFPSAGRDDAHITYWAAHSLSQYDEILNYNGERVEQSSSLLHVLLLAFLQRLTTLDVALLGKPFGVIFGVASVVAVYKLTRRIAEQAAFPAAILTATTTYFVYWSFGGLESTLVAFTGLILIIAYGDYLSGARRGLSTMALPTLTTVLFVLVRPETALVLICSLVGAIMFVYGITFLARRAGRATGNADATRWIALLVITGIVFAGLIAFRMWYFDSPLPQPVIAKSKGTSLDTLTAGFNYLETYLVNSGRTVTILALLSVFGAGTVVWTQLRSSKVEPYSLLSVLFVVVYVSFVLFSGGDWMEGGRFLVPILPEAMMLIPLGFIHFTKSRELLIALTLTLVVLASRNAVNFSATKSTSTPIWESVRMPEDFEATRYPWFERQNRVNARDIGVAYTLDQIVDRVIAYKKEPVTIMSSQMGMVAYHLAIDHFGQVHFIDRYGLADRRLSSCSLTRALPRHAYGMNLGYSTYFDSWKELEELCQIPRPDIIFDLDLGHIDTEVVDQNGYEIMYFQDGNVMADGVLKGAVVLGTQYIALRDDLLSAVQGIEPLSISFPSGSD